ncbi:MAG TPA: MarR family transcriptional regulator [Micromonosporaceae bacterium]
MSDSDDRGELVERIIRLQHDLGRAWAHDRSLPVLASTLTMQQFKVVMILSLQGSASGQELAQQLGVGLGTVTGIVDRLVARRLVERHEDPDDRRIRRVALTPAGRELADEVVHAGLSRFRCVLELLDTETLRAFENVMREFAAAAIRFAARS